MTIKMTWEIPSKNYGLNQCGILINWRIAPPIDQSHVLIHGLKSILMLTISLMESQFLLILIIYLHCHPTGPSGLGQALGENEPTATEREDSKRGPKSSFGPHPVLLHHSVTSAWVQQRMLQCATGNSWSIYWVMLCLSWGSLGWKWAHTATEREDNNNITEIL
jgi:hypothetical protein